MAYRRRSSLLWIAGVALGALLVCTQPVRAENAEWSDLLKAFKDTWEIGKVDQPKTWDHFRASKRAAAKHLGVSQDARAIPVLMAAHKKQLRFIEKIKKEHAARLAKWKKLQPAMERALQAKPKRDDGKMMVTPSEQAWIKEKERLEHLWAETLREDEIAEYTRKAMGKVTDSVEGKEHEKALGYILKAAGNGDDPDQVEFIRLLGYVAGNPVTLALEKYAASMQPFVVLAALEALGRQNAERSIETLLGRLDDPRWQVRVSALKGLAFYQDAGVVEALLERVASEDGVMQRHYFSALSRMVTAEVTGAVGAWRKWWKENKPKVLETWKTGGRVGPVENDPDPIMVRSEGGGHTSFYGLKTESKHIIFVLDISGSMGEHSGKDAGGRYRIDVAKEEIKKAIRSLTSEESDERGVSSFNIVVYAADVRVFKEGKMIPATKKNKEKAFEWIDELEAIGATNIFDALEQAFLIIGTRKAKKQLEKGADTIFLMTDGQPNRGKITAPPLIRQEIAKMNRDRRITINTIGVGDGHAYEFLEKLAAENDGEYVSRGKPPKKKEEEEKKAEEEKKKKEEEEEGKKKDPPGEGGEKK